MVCFIRSCALGILLYCNTMPKYYCLIREGQYIQVLHFSLIHCYPTNSVAMEKLFPHITCGVCFKPYKDPRTLPCLHSFCLQCLHHEIGKSGSQQLFQCPICDRNTSIPVEGASVLPQNLHVGFEVEVAGYMSKMVNNSDVACDHCIDGGNGPAVVFCCTCH